MFVVGKRKKSFPSRFPVDFALIREGGDTMWKSHERRGWGINKRAASGESRCTQSAPDRGGVRCQGPRRKHPPPEPAHSAYAMNSTTPPPIAPDGDVAVGYVLVPFVLITIIGVAAAVVSGYRGRLAWYELQKALKNEKATWCRKLQKQFWSVSGHVHTQEAKVRLLIFEC